jgi:large subunit ribosomal protein L31
VPFPGTSRVLTFGQGKYSNPSYNPRFSAVEKCATWCGEAVDTSAQIRKSQLSERSIMKDGIHPNYREVCFVDQSNGFKFVTRSTMGSKESIKMEDGREMPLIKLETTSETHPFYTGTQKSIDSLGGRVEKFRNKFAGFAKK